MLQKVWSAPVYWSAPLHGLHVLALPVEKKPSSHLVFLVPSHAKPGGQGGQKRAPLSAASALALSAAAGNVPLPQAFLLLPSQLWPSGHAWQ